MQVLAAYSESGGVTKTTTAVSLAMIAAAEGRRTLLVDLDPRAAASKWIDVQPKEKGWHSGAILADEHSHEWVKEIVVSGNWSDHLSVIPSSRTVSNRESDQSEPFAEMRLKKALSVLDYDTVVLDCPNRQGGPLTVAALNAVDTMVYAATPTAAGIDGVLGARQSVSRFRENRRLMGAADSISAEHIVVSGVHDTVSPRAERAALEDLDATGILCRPFIPHRTIVQQVQLTNEWYGKYGKGQPVIDAYTNVWRVIAK